MGFGCVRHKIWLLFINSLVRKAADTPEGARLIAQFRRENADTAAAARDLAATLYGR